MAVLAKPESIDPWPGGHDFHNFGKNFMDILTMHSVCVEVENIFENLTFFIFSPAFDAPRTVESWIL